MTFAYFSVASYVLDDVEYKQIALLWSVLFVTVSVIYRPIEQLLSRTIADRRARGFEADHPLRTPMLIQAGFALGFLVVALALRGPIEDDLFDGSATLYWILVVAVLAYAASYFARGWLARAPVVRPLRRARVPRGVLAAGVRARGGGGDRRRASRRSRSAWRRRRSCRWSWCRGRSRAGRVGDAASGATDEEALGLARGGRFAVAVLAIMLAEQTLLNAGVLLVDWTAEDAAVAGFVFNVLLIARAPLQLFQAIQGSLLPHLAGLEAREGRGGVRARDPRHDAGHRRLRGRGRARAARARPVGDGHPLRRRVHLRPLGPRAGRARHGRPPDRRHAQPGRARARPRRRRGGVLAGHAPPRSWSSWSARSSTTSCVRAQVGYCGAAALLCALLAVLYRATSSSSTEPRRSGPA